METMELTNLKNLEKHLEENGMVLVDNITLEDDGGRNIIIICNTDAENSDEYFLLETYSMWEAFDFLKHNGHLTAVAV